LALIKPNIPVRFNTTVLFFVIIRLVGSAHFKTLLLLFVVIFFLVRMKPSER
jgi:hypothetical protein